MIIAGVQDLPDLAGLLEDAAAIKAAAAHGDLGRPLEGKSAVLVFEKNSTRTRLSFEIGLRKLGMSVSTLDCAGSQLARGESLEDTGAVLGRYADLIVHRATSHDRFLRLADRAGVPTINALTDQEHPCQTLADLLTMQEHLGDLVGRKLTWVGDGNNVCNSTILGAAAMGMDVHVATPPGYGPDLEIVQAARGLGGSICLHHDPQHAVVEADVVMTDAWTSMGDEDTQADRLAAFSGFTVDDAIMGLAAPAALFMHCLPGHWGQEATQEVAHGPQSIIYDQAENRMWAQMALAMALLAPPEPTHQQRLIMAA